MPCIKCETDAMYNGEDMYKWGEDGDCKYLSLKECEEANDVRATDEMLDYYSKAILSTKAYSHADSLIEEDKVDTESSWSFDSEDGNALLGEDSSRS